MGKSDEHHNGPDVRKEARKLKQTSDEFLAHYGVVGMKWGKRSGSLGDRFKGAAADRNQRNTRRNDHMLAISKKIDDAPKNFKNLSKGKKVGVVAGAVGLTVATGGTAAASIAGGYLGNKISKRTLTKRVDKLSDQRKRLESGNLSKKDKFDAVMNTSVVDLLVSRRDKKGY